MFQKTYTIDAKSLADADANARRKFEHVRGLQPIDETVVCELESLVAIREATKHDLTDPGHRGRLMRAAARDGATMDEVEAAKRANGAWPAGD